MNTKLIIVCKGIAVKLNRGEKLDDILTLYTKLTPDEKKEINKYFTNN